MITLTAILLSASMAAAIDRNPCGVPNAKQVFVFPPYSDHDVHRVKIDDDLDLDVQSAPAGPIDFRNAASGALVYSMAREEYDGYLTRPDGELPKSDGSVVQVALPGGTFIVDPSSTLSRNGAWIFVCWKSTASSTERSGHHAELYQGIELFDDGTGLIRRKDGSSMPLPQFRYQVQIEGTGVSEDGKRVGWLVDQPNCCTSYAVPKLLVIFRDGRVERTFDEGQCIFEWVFVRKGAAVSYYTSTLHGTDYRSFYLRDIATSNLLGTYTYPDSYEFTDSEAKRAAAIESAPGWVKAIGSSAR